MGLCALLWIIAVLVAVIMVEVVTNMVHDFPQWTEALEKKRAYKTAKIPRVIVEIYRYTNCNFGVIF